VRTLCNVHEAERNARIEEQAKKDGLELWQKN
jgi:cell division protein FtsL